jgi:putative CocE/NonD family hydrolase
MTDQRLAFDVKVGDESDRSEERLMRPNTGPALITKVRWGLKIPMRDGVRLHATLYEPDVEGSPPLPVIFTLTPYVAQIFHKQATHFASLGFAFLAVDVRGRGNSEGEFRPLIQESQDALDTINWLAGQAFCNGQVAMWGGSYGGYTQWAAAKRRPPALKTIVPVAAPYVGIDFPARNNIAFPYIMQWLTLVAGKTLQDRIFWGSERWWRSLWLRWAQSGRSFESLDEWLGMPSETFKEWSAHLTDSAYWTKYNPTAAEYAAIDIPVLSITGIYDSDQPGALAHYRKHTQSGSPSAKSHYLVIGPWDHAGTRAPSQTFAGMTFGPASVLDLQRLHCDWLGWVLDNAPFPRFLRNKVCYYVTGAETWRCAASLDDVTSHHFQFQLASSMGAASVFQSGKLVEGEGFGGPDTYKYDPVVTAHLAREADSAIPFALRPTFPVDDITDQRMVLGSDGCALVYHSEPFQEPVEVSGFFGLQAWLAIDQPDTDFQVAIYEITSSGQSIFLSNDVRRARNRNGISSEELVTTTDPLLYQFDSFTFISRLIAEGSRLRLVIGPVDSINFQRNYNSGERPAAETVRSGRTVVVQLYHDASHKSVLDVPIARPLLDE